MIGIVDYGSGNIQAIANIYKRLNIDCKVIQKPEELKRADKFILPGVGAFDETMKQLMSSGLKEELDDLVLLKKVPVLGICVGMQIMANSSDEGVIPGLGWIKGKVRKFDASSISKKPYLPHMGWNNALNSSNHQLFNDIDYEQGFYFVHSYYFDCHDDGNVLSTCNYGVEFAAAIFDNHIFGMQFHPEKSHANGTKLLENFAKLDVC